MPRFESTLAETIVHLSIVTLSNEKKKKQSAKTGFEIVIVVGDHGSIQLIDKNGEILDSGAVELPAGIKVSAVAMVDTDAHIILALTNHNMVVIRFNVRLRGRLIAGRRHNCRDEQLNLDLDHDLVSNNAKKEKHAFGSGVLQAQLCISDSQMVGNVNNDYFYSETDPRRRIRREKLLIIDPDASASSEESVDASVDASVDVRDEESSTDDGSSHNVMEIVSDNKSPPLSTMTALASMRLRGRLSMIVAGDENATLNFIGPNMTLSSSHQLRQVTNITKKKFKKNQFHCGSQK